MLTDTNGKKRRCKILRVTSELLVSFFQGGYHYPYTISGDALPDDAKIVEARIIGGEDVIELLIESSGFPEVLPEGRTPDTFVPVVQSSMGPRC